MLTAVPPPINPAYCLLVILASIALFATAIVGVAPSPELLVIVTLVPCTKLST